jgi:hypothetical protein
MSSNQTRILKQVDKSTCSVETVRRGWVSWRGLVGFASEIWTVVTAQLQHLYFTKGKLAKPILEIRTGQT